MDDLSASKRSKIDRDLGEAGLVFVDHCGTGITRRRCGCGFSYLDPRGNRICDEHVIDRIRALAVPPAWNDVWISPDPKGFVQATGRDAKGRKQYRYHPQWTEFRNTLKFDELVEFARALSRMRARVDSDLRTRGLSRAKVLASVVWLLDNLLIRIGNETYAQANGSYGLTTLRKRHLEITGACMHFRFTGKSGKQWNLRHTDRRIARVIRSMHELGGQHLFQYANGDGSYHNVQSEDVNAYISQAGSGDFGSRQFRTWAGTCVAANELLQAGPPDSGAASRRIVNAAVDRVASQLKNTRAVCRQCYIHPRVIEAFEAGTLRAELEQASARCRTTEWMTREERAILKWLGEE